jgi:predicted chitinase
VPATYTVRPGDTLSGIAQAVLGDGNRWREIWDLNKDQITDPNIIHAGQVLKLPNGANAPVAPPPPPADLPFNLTPEQIAQALGSPVANVRQHWPTIAKALQDQGITSRAGIIAALATIGVEVGNFLPIHEYGGDAYYAKYNNRPDLGNRPGTNDGVVYHGRGFIQLTGRANYETYGRELGIDLVGNPDLALDPEVGAKVLALYFKKRGTVDMANRGDWEAVRRSVNGGLNGWDRFSRIVRTLEGMAR